MKYLFYKKTKKNNSKSTKSLKSAKSKTIEINSIPKNKKYKKKDIQQLHKKDFKKLNSNEKKKLLNYWIHEKLYKKIIPKMMLTSWFENNYTFNKQTKSASNLKCQIGNGNGYGSKDFLKYIDIRENIRKIDMDIEKIIGKTPDKYIIKFINLLLNELGLSNMLCSGL